MNKTSIHWLSSAKKSLDSVKSYIEKIDYMDTTSDEWRYLGLLKEDLQELFWRFSDLKSVAGIDEKL